jgi:hypothetical protein
MKTLNILFAFFLFPISLSAQTFEHHYDANQGQIFEVSPNEFVYGMIDDSLHQFRVYSLDHTLMKTFNLVPNYADLYYTFNLSRTLFNGDDYLELLYTWSKSTPPSNNGVKVLNEEGLELFSKDSGWEVSLFNTSQGSKMIISPLNFLSSRSVDVYSLNGIVLNSDELDLYEDCFLSPNPSSGNIDVKFTNLKHEDLLLSIYTTTGQLIKEFNIHTKDQKITFNVSEFAPGTYLFRAHSNNFSTQYKKFIVK